MLSPILNHGDFCKRSGKGGGQSLSWGQSLAKGHLNVKLRERRISISFVVSKSYSLKSSQAVRQGHILVFPLSISQSLPLFGLSLFIRSVSGRESPFGLSHTEQRPPTKTEECSKRLRAFISNKTRQEKG